MIPVSQIATQLDDLHSERLFAPAAVRLAVELTRMDCADLLDADRWPVSKSQFGNLGALFDGPLVFTNVRGVVVGLCPRASVVYKIENPIGTRWLTTYSSDGSEDGFLPVQLTLEQAQLRCEQHRRLTSAVALAVVVAQTTCGD